MNAAYLGRALEVMPEVVRMTVRDEGVAMTIEPDEGSAFLDCFAIVMPLRV